MNHIARTLHVIVLHRLGSASNASAASVSYGSNMQGEIYGGYPVTFPLPLFSQVPVFMVQHDDNVVLVELTVLDFTETWVCVWVHACMCAHKNG